MLIIIGAPIPSLIKSYTKPDKKKFKSNKVAADTEQEYQERNSHLEIQKRQA